MCLTPQFAALICLPDARLFCCHLGSDVAGSVVLWQQLF